MSEQVMDLQHKRSEIEALKAKLTPQYLEGATKESLEADKQNLTNIVGEYVKKYDEVDWISTPAVLTINHEQNRTEMENAKRDLTKLLDDQLQTSNPPGTSQATILGDLTNIFAQITLEKEKFTPEYLAKTDSTLIQAKKGEIRKLINDYDTKAAKVTEGTLTPEGKAKWTEEKDGIASLKIDIEALFNTPPPQDADKKSGKKTLEGEQDAAVIPPSVETKLDQLIGELQKVKTELGDIKKESVKEQSLTHQIENLKSHFERRIREAGKETDDGGPSRQPIPTVAQQAASDTEQEVKNLLTNLKTTMIKAETAKEVVTFQFLDEAKPEELRERITRLETAAKNVNITIQKLEGMALSSTQKAELEGYKAKGGELVEYFKRILTEALTAKTRQTGPTLTSAKPGAPKPGAPEPETPDVEEFFDTVGIPMNQDPVVGNPDSTIRKRLNELKKLLDEARNARYELTFATLSTMTKEELEAKLGDVLGQFGMIEVEMELLQQMNLGSVQRAELAGYKGDAEKQKKFLNQTLNEAIARVHTEQIDPEIVEPTNDPSQENAFQMVPIKLETIQIPTFSGNLSEWISFKDIFITYIHNNPRLNNTLKFHQLRSKLRGQALDTVKGYQITGLNYHAAWQDLERRYDQTDELVQEYIRKFLEVPSIIGRANLPRLRTIVDATNQMIRALPSLGADVHNWGPFICLIITTKLDEETRMDWRKHIGLRTNTTVTELIAFMETRSREYQQSQGDKLSQMLRGNIQQGSSSRFPRRNLFAIEKKGPNKKNLAVKKMDSNKQVLAVEKKEEKKKTPKKCLVCQGDHWTWHCRKLRKECARVRREIIETFGGCVRCLVEHEAGACKLGACPYCGEDHNILLCRKREADNPERRNQNQ